MRLKDLKADRPIKAYLYIREANVRDSKNGSRFIRLQLSDPDYNEITAYVWNAGEADIEDYQAGRIVGIAGKGKEFQGNLQLDIQRIRLANEGDSVTLDQFIETAPYSSEDMLDEIDHAIASFENEDMKKITEAVVDGKRDRLEYFPAAKTFHHAVRGGLLYHTVSMMRLGKQLAKLYPFVNEDLLTAGIILHDMGKVDEMHASENGVVDDYTPEGKLIGHITTEITEVDRLGRELNIDPEVLMVLEHMILSHHYEPEYGSPVKPMFPEAELLHYIDVIDARMNTMGKIENQLEPGQFSEKAFSLDNIRLYKPKID
ncbi:MAG: 3'-5' exoribonuclease YhaM family protein [Eubacteriaceae bacterium]|jgi:3'-5' exoribonuclease